MRNYRIVAIILILVGQLSVPAQAQVIPGRWEKVEALQLGPQITVGLKNGDRIEGQFEELSPSELLLRTGTAQAAILRAEIQRISTREADRLDEGAILGAGVCAGFALVGHAMSESSLSDKTLLGVTLMAGIGAANWRRDRRSQGDGSRALPGPLTLYCREEEE